MKKVPMKDPRDDNFRKLKRRNMIIMIISLMGVVFFAIIYPRL